MNELLLLFIIIQIFSCMQKNIKMINTQKNAYKINEVYIIKSLYNNNYFAYNKNKLILSEILNQIRILKIKPGTYIIYFNQFKRIGIDSNNKIQIYNEDKNINNKKLFWNLIKIENNQYLIQNKYNHEYMVVYKDTIKLTKNLNAYSKNIEKKFLFVIIKLQLRKFPLILVLNFAISIFFSLFLILL